MVVLGLHHIPPDDGCIAVIIVLLVGDEINLAQELLLMVFELARHCCGLQQQDFVKSLDECWKLDSNQLHLELFEPHIPIIEALKR